MTWVAPRVSVVVVTFNARHDITRCLEGVFAQSYADLEVIVVDNASTDGTPDVVRHQFPRARLIVSRRNVGYGGGNNLGAATASGEIIVFLNPDAVPELGWLEHLARAMQQHGRQLATSKITLLRNQERLNSGGNLIHFLGLSFCRGLQAQRSRFATPELVSGASGAAFAISRQLFERLGGFDDTLFLYHDDVDLSLRALLAGEPCLYVPDAVVAHDYSLSLPPIKWGWIEAHRYAVLLKTFSLRTLLVLLPALVLMDLVTLAYLALRGPDFVRAKVSSYAWVVRHAAAIGSARRRAQGFFVGFGQLIVQTASDSVAGRAPVV